MPLAWDDLVRYGLTLPETAVSTSYGTPALKVKGKLLARLKEDGESVVVPVADLDAKEALLAAYPKELFTTAHYDGYALVLVRLGRARKGFVEGMVREAYLNVAPVKLAAALGKGKK